MTHNSYIYYVKILRTGYFAYLNYIILLVGEVSLKLDEVMKIVCRVSLTSRFAEDRYFLKMMITLTFTNI